MKWSRVSSHCIRAGDYQIAKYTCSGVDHYEVRYTGELIADESDPNTAKRAATQHKNQQGSAAQ